MSDLEPLWITEAEVVRTLDLGAAISALERGLAAEARGEVRSLEKTQVGFGAGDNLHALGAVLAGDDLAGTKTWAHTGGGATPLLILWRASDGALAAVVEAFALGQLRTSGVSAVATARLAADGADELGIVGTGKQALAQVAAVGAVRRLHRVRVFGPSPERRRAFAARVERELGLPAVVAGSVASAVEGAPIVTTITRAREPFLEAAMLARGAHVNAIGAIVPERAEVARDVFARVDLAVADSPEQVGRASREFREAAGRRPPGLPDAPVALSALVAGAARRPADGDLTLFKAMGMGLSDLALGAEVLRAARALGFGRPFDRPRRVAPELRGAVLRETRDGSGSAAPARRPAAVGPEGA